MNTEEVLHAEAGEFEQTNNEETKKQEYKALMHWRISENATKLIEASKITSEQLLEKIKKELETRKEPKLKYSEVNELNLFINFVAGVISAIDDSDGGKVMKRELNTGVNNGLTHLYTKADVGFDVPAFTELDMIKKLRNLNTTLERRFDEIISLYAPEKKKEDSLHPYED